jgi:hypothetical protein
MAVHDFLVRIISLTVHYKVESIMSSIQILILVPAAINRFDMETCQGTRMKVVGVRDKKVNNDENGLPNPRNKKPHTALYERPRTHMRVVGTRDEQVDW